MTDQLLPGINAAVDKLMSRLAEAEFALSHCKVARSRSALEHEIASLERRLAMAERMQDRIVCGKGPR